MSFWLLFVCVQTHFGNSDGESTTSSTSSMKGGNSSTNGSDLDKNNILKPTFGTLAEEGHKVFKAYRTDLKERFLSHCEVTRQGTVLRDTTLIVFHKPEVTPELRLNPSPSCNDVQSMINSALERQVKSIDELLHRLIEEKDGKILLILLVLLVLHKPIDKKVAHRWAALLCQTHQPNR
jgi:hypothetical protein